jgi:RNA 2',3'-cyclic 3'-phosphodiesterase
VTRTAKQGVRRSTSESWRVFCALNLTPEVRERMIEHINRLKELAPHVKASWSREHNLHLTLKFLGQVKTSRLPQLSKAAAAATSGLSTFEVSIEETGVFPNPRRPRVLWLGVKDDSGTLAELHRRLEEACAGEGFAKEQRRFHPHLTLARLRNPQEAQELVTAHQQLSFEPVAVKIAELLVIRSELSPNGSRYSVISQHKLGAPTD